MEQTPSGRNDGTAVACSLRPQQRLGRALQGQKTALGATASAARGASGGGWQLCDVSVIAPPNTVETVTHEQMFALWPSSRKDLQRWGCVFVAVSVMVAVVVAVSVIVAAVVLHEPQGLAGSPALHASPSPPPPPTAPVPTPAPASPLAHPMSQPQLVVAAASVAPTTDNSSLVLATTVGIDDVAVVHTGSATPIVTVGGHATLAETTIVAGSTGGAVDEGSSKGETTVVTTAVSSPADGNADAGTVVAPVVVEKSPGGNASRTETTTAAAAAAAASTRSSTGGAGDEGSSKGETTVVATAVSSPADGNADAGTVVAPVVVEKSPGGNASRTETTTAAAAAAAASTRSSTGGAGDEGSSKGETTVVATAVSSPADGNANAGTVVAPVVAERPSPGGDASRTETTAAAGGHARLLFP
eukprot:COSAG01_NODE_7048_length_3376_cov_40.918828_2_plen_416_part_00